MRIIITGSKTFSDYKFLAKTLDDLTVKLDQIVVVSSHAEGAEKLGEKWAMENMFTYIIHHTTKKHPQTEINQEMVNDADALVVFGKGFESVDLISKAKKKGLKVKVVKV